MSFFSGFLSSIWGNAFGFGLLTMRYYAVTCQLLALLACCAYMYSKIRKPWLCLFITGICSFLTNSSYLCLVFGWDATSTLFIVLTAVVLFLYIDNPLKITWLILAGLLTTCAAFSRIPNVVIAPIVVAIILAYKPNGFTLKQRISNAAIYVLTVAILSAILICSAYGSFTAYFQKIAEGAVSNHPFWTIIKIYLDSSFRLIFEIAILCLIYSIVRSTNQSNINKYLLAIFVAPIGVVFFSMYINSQPLQFTTSNLAFFISLLALYYLKIIQQHPLTYFSQHIVNPNILKLCIIGIFVFMPMIGSNTGLYKTIPFILFPLFLSFAWKQLNKTIIIFMVIVTTISGIIMMTSLYRDSFFAPGWRDNSASSNVAQLKGIRTTHEQALVVENLDSIINTNKNANIILISDYAERFIGYYLKGQKPTYHFHNWNFNNLNDPQFVSATIDSLSNSQNPHTMVLLVGYTPEADQSLMGTQLNQLHPTKIEEFPSLKLYHFHN